MSELPIADLEHDPRKPFSFPRPARPEPLPDVVRVPALGEIAGLIERFFPLIRDRYPRALQSPTRQLLGEATRAPANPPMRILRTANAMGLFVAERDCFEPEWQVRTKFIEHLDAPDEAKAIVAAAREWAKTMGAISLDGAPLAASTPEPEPPAAVKAPARKRAKRGAARTRSRGSVDRPSLKRERQALSS